MKKFVALAFVSTAIAACGTSTEPTSSVAAAKVGGVYNLVQCPSLSPELGGHNTLSMDVVVGADGFASSFKAPALENAPSAEGKLSGKAKASGSKLSIQASGKLEIDRTKKTFAAIESLEFDTAAGTVSIFHLVNGTNDVHSDDRTFSNCKFSNLGLLRR